METINAWAKLQKLESLASPDVGMGRQKIIKSVHAELSVTLAALKYRTESKNGGFLPFAIDVGVTKLCCHLCSTFLEKLEATEGVRVVVRGCHGKVYHGWALPPHTPPAVRWNFLETVDHAISDLYFDLRQRQPRKDSSPQSVKSESSVFERVSLKVPAMLQSVADTLSE